MSRCRASSTSRNRCCCRCCARAGAGSSTYRRSAALIGNRGQVNYAAAKGALISATRALALEVATRGVTVNAIAPGIISTSMSADHFDDAAIARLVPMQRAGSADEVASLIDFLAADGAGYITGQVVSINGGMF